MVDPNQIRNKVLKQENEITNEQEAIVEKSKAVMSNLHKRSGKFMERKI